MNQNDPFSVLAALLKYSAQPIKGSAFGTRDQLRPLIELGLLVAEGYVPTLICNECEIPHPAPVAQTGRGWICDRLGCEFDTDEDLRAYRVRPDLLLAALSSALETTSEGRPVPGHESLWALGSVKFETFRMELYFKPRIQQLDEFIEILDSIRCRPRADGTGVLTADALDLQPQLLPARTAVIPLREVAQINKFGDLAMDVEQIARQVLPASAFKGTRRGAPASQREKIFVVLDTMTAENEPIETSNAGLSTIRKNFSVLYPDQPVPARDTIRIAIGRWQEEN